MRRMTMICLLERWERYLRFGGYIGVGGIMSCVDLW